MMRKAIFLAVIGLFSLSYADGNSPILDYYKPIQTDSLDKRVNYIESTFNAKIENIIEQIKVIQNKQSDYENAMKYMAVQTKKEIEELKTQVEILSNEIAKLKVKNPSAQQLKESKEAELTNFCTTQKSTSIVDAEGNVITKIRKGIRLAVLDESDQNYEVKYKGSVGYVSKKYCKLDRRVVPLF
jgi:hypothetical protein